MMEKRKIFIANNTVKCTNNFSSRFVSSVKLFGNFQLDGD